MQADGVKNKNNVVDATIKGEVFREEQGSGGRCKSQNPKLDTLKHMDSNRQTQSIMVLSVAGAPPCSQSRTVSE